MKDEKNSLWGKYDDLGIASIPKRHQNLSGRISYDYKNRYFIDANFGYTGSAQFKKENSSVSFLPLPQDGFLPLMHGGQRNYLGLRSSKFAALTVS